MAELHLHGGRAVTAAVLAALSGMKGLRPAEPGEFTRRAFLNGKLDLTATEGLADLIAAETEAQRKQAFRALSGEFGRLVDSWRDRLLKALAYAEAAIDFAEDDPAVAEGGWRKIPGEVGREIAQAMADNRRGERLRDGVMIAILGPPNAGKSSLLNKLAGREAAIVSAQAGTTRDVIEVHLDLGGYPVILADTAGLRETADEVESEGVRRALARAEAANIKLLLIEPDGKIDSESKRIIDRNTVLVASKSDLSRDPTKFVQDLKALAGSTPRAVVAVSAKTDAGIPELLKVLETAVSENLGAAGEAPAITRARHRQSLEECREALARFETAEGELAAEDLRLAVRSLGRVTGRVEVEDLLDVIFRDFCIGK
jgi:tRNA modification GTPase